MNYVEIFIWEQRSISFVSLLNIFRIKTNLESKYSSHIAMQTYPNGNKEQGIYISFWPANMCNIYNAGENDGRYMCKRADSHFHECLMTDRISGEGGRKPDKIHKLEQMNTDNIHEGFRTLKRMVENGDDWRAFSNNCSTFIFKLICMSRPEWKEIYKNPVVREDDSRFEQINIFSLNRIYLSFKYWAFICLITLIPSLIAKLSKHLDIFSRFFVKAENIFEGYLLNKYPTALHPNHSTGSEAFKTVSKHLIVIYFLKEMDALMRIICEKNECLKYLYNIILGIKYFIYRNNFYDVFIKIYLNSLLMALISLIEVNNDNWKSIINYLIKHVSIFLASPAIHHIPNATKLFLQMVIRPAKENIAINNGGLLTFLFFRAFFNPLVSLIFIAPFRFSESISTPQKIFELCKKLNVEEVLSSENSNASSTFPQPPRFIRHITSSRLFSYTKDIAVTVAIGQALRYVE